MHQFELSTPLLEQLVSTAKKATCTRSKCGTIILAKDTEDIIGTGYNSMPCNLVGECKKDLLPKDHKSDRTCCMHAEVRAIMDVLKNNPDKINGSKLIFLRLDSQGNPLPAEDIYCTICSKMALDAGVELFCLLTPSGWVSYQTDEYNILSFAQAKIHREFRDGIRETIL
jgi:deoxycytidylate deaminase